MARYRSAEIFNRVIDAGTAWRILESTDEAINLLLDVDGTEPALRAKLDDSSPIYTRITNLEDTYGKYIFHYRIASGTSGSFSLESEVHAQAEPTFNHWADGLDALVFKASSTSPYWPTGEYVYADDGSMVTIDPASGFSWNSGTRQISYTLDLGGGASIDGGYYPLALVFVARIKLRYFSAIAKDPVIDLGVEGVETRLAPTGGTSGQVLTKGSNTDFDLTWATVSGATLASTEPPAVSSSTSGAVGVATDVARSDHGHDLGAHTHADAATGGALAGYAAAAAGMPTGGTTGQVIKKNSASDHDVAWADESTGSHNLGGAEHSADTLANLNAKISDATLDDSSDPRDPNAHDLSGAAHNSTTLAALNAKISDATLDDSSDARDPNTHDNTAHSAAYIEYSSAMMAALIYG